MLYLFIYTAMQCDFGHLKGFVNDFVFAAGGFGFDVFDDDFAVFLAVCKYSRIMAI